MSPTAISIGAPADRIMGIVVSSTVLNTLDVLLFISDQIPNPAATHPLNYSVWKREIKCESFHQ